MPPDSSAEVQISGLSYGQQRMWTLDRLVPAGSVYNVSSAFRLVGMLDVAALRGALNDIVQRHEVLRTRFELEQEGPVQVIAAELPLALAMTDISALAPEQREAQARRLAEEELQTPFDLGRGPLLRARLIRLREDEHRLLLTLHHIITDGWSMGLLERELSALYGARCRGEANPLSPLPVQYADFAVWQREWLRGAALEQQLVYWKPALADLPTLELPTDRPRPDLPSYIGDELHFEIGEALTRKLKALGQRDGATLFMTLLAAFQVLLYRYTGQEDVAVGVPIAGRRRPELEGLIGFFVNTLVMRGDLSGEPSFREYLVRVRARALDAYAHQDLPFEKLVEELHPKRDLSRNPLFQVALAFNNTPPRELQLEGLDVQKLRRAFGESAKFDLQLSATEEAGKVRMRFEYATDLFDAGTIARMAEHWRVLLEGIVADPEQTISRLPLLMPEERRQLLAVWNDTTVEYPHDRCVHELFEAQVLRSPDAVALAYGAQQLTYAELNAQANRLAHHLRTLGVGADALVALYLERSLEQVVALLAILKAGGAYVPLDPSYPAERLAFMLDDTRVPVLLTQQRLREQLPAIAGRVVCVDAELTRIGAEPTDNPPRLATPDSVAYVIYTSGSTGRPKGVMIEQHSLVNYVTWLQREFPLDEKDRILQSTPTIFDVSVLEIFWPLTTGARVELVEPELHRSAVSLVDLAKRRGVTVLQAVPSMLGMLVDVPGFAQLDRLRRVFTAGEELSAGLVRRFHEVSAAELVNGYGPTETTVYSTYWRCARGDPRPVIPIGFPVANTQVRILDAFDAPVPVGVVGEVCIGGDGVGRGYLGRPDLTSERFVHDPHSEDPDARIYRTGDLATYLPDGAIKFLGRRDHQIKLRGFRIELGEIEAVLAQHPSVANAIVVAREDTPGDRRLVAYLLTNDTRPPIAHDLREFAKTRLPDYMVPAAFVTLERFPFTATGKVDRGGFPVPAQENLAAANEYAPPRDETERHLCRVWSEALGVERVGIDDDFFEIGGNSLLGARLFARLDQQFGRSLPLGVLFQTPTVRGLAELLRSAAPTDGGISLVAITRRSSRLPVFAVPGVGGNVFALADLARALGPDQAFFALQSVGVDGTREPLQTIEAMARLYLSEVRAIRPRGPYALIGVCFGATVAFEMARQIAESGDNVAFLGLLDPTSIGGEQAGESVQSVPRVVARARAAGAFAQGRLQLYRREMAGLGYRDRVDFVAHKLTKLLRRTIGRSSLDDVRLEMSLANVYRTNLAALKHFERKPINGNVKVIAIFQTPRHARARFEVDWLKQLPGEAVRIMVPGKDSGDMLSGANVRILADALAPQLKKAMNQE